MAAKLRKLIQNIAKSAKKNHFVGIIVSKSKRKRVFLPPAASSQRGGWLSEGDGAVAHAGGRSQRRQSGRYDARNHLQNGFPSVLFHVNVCLS